MSDGNDAADSPADHADENTTNVAIRDSIHERVVARIDRSDFETPAEYVEFTLEEVLSRVESGEEMAGGVGSDPLDREDDEERSEEVESRLESLGYL